MRMRPPVRKFALTLHILSSIGWIGSVTVYLVLASVGLTSREDQMVRATDAALGPTGWFVILPLCLAALATGLVSSLGTTWGLFRHYWVVIKLLINLASTLALLIHLGPISRLSQAALSPIWAGPALAGLRSDLAVKSGAALIVLLVATVLAVYKPRGLTPYGQRKQSSQRKPAPDTETSAPLDRVQPQLKKAPLRFGLPPDPSGHTGGTNT